jgi:hypothetical protein
MTWAICGFSNHAKLTRHLKAWDSYTVLPHGCHRVLTNFSVARLRC